MGVFETLLFGSAFFLTVWAVAYHLIKSAVRNGTLEALRIHQASVRERFDLGDEKSPNSR